MHFFALLIAISVSQYLNIILGKTFTNLGLLKTVLMYTPLLLVQTFSFGYYFKEGLKENNYMILVLTSISITVIVSCFIQIYIFQKPMITKDLIAISIIILGLFVYFKN